MGKMNKVAQSVLPITLSMLLVTPPVVGSAQSSNQANITYKDWTNLLSKEKQQEISFTNIKQEKEQTTKNEYIIKTDKPIASSVHKKAGATVVKSYSKLGFDVIRVTDEKKLEAAIKVYEKPRVFVLFQKVFHMRS
ncbi:S8 family serine peptidase [Bacillus coahuilensis]|uniref:S8 family serine peptidase n=1 Tax=Bacillus coahuilensis TaxID=408580 RepID=UPI00018513C9|nr:hypothetical protein [Bacillus coahuilensis]